MANTELNNKIQIFLKNCIDDGLVPDQPQEIKTRVWVNDPKRHKKLKEAFELDGDDILTTKFWDDYFDLALHIGTFETDTASTTSACCCSCCL